MPDTALANRYDVPATRLIEMAQRTLDEDLALDFDPGPVVARLRREGCVHEWAIVTATDDQGVSDISPECTRCSIRVLDGYRAYYPKRDVVPQPEDRRDD